MDTEENIHSDDDVNSMEYLVKRSLLAKNKLAIILQQGDETLYCCVQCPIRSALKEELEKHLLVHNREYKHLCGICGTALKRKEHLDRHTLEHQQVRPHICTICSKAFKRKEHLNVHLSIHSGDKTEVCMLCQKSFYRRDHLQKHLQTHGKILMEQSMQILGDKELLEIKAEVLDEDYNSSPYSEDSAMSTDILQDNPVVIDTASFRDSARPHMCGICHKTYKRKDHLKLHMNTHLKNEGRACSECGKVFQREEQLLVHMNVHLSQYAMPFEGHDDSKTQLHCMLEENVIDPSTFLTENSLLVPREISMAIPITMDAVGSERRHECGICHKRFKRRQHLKVHYNTHGRSEPWLRCIKCSKGFNSDDDLENHKCAALHVPVQDSLNIKSTGAPAGNKKENKYPIEEVILPIESSIEDSTQYAIRDESALPVPQRVFVCKWCLKPFKRKDHYKIHLHIHTGVKTFFCTHCGKGFYRKDHLQKHTQIHANKPKVKKPVPGLLSLDMVLKKKEIKPEITITAPSCSKLRVPLQMKVPYQVVTSMDNGELTSVTYDPHAEFII